MGGKKNNAYDEQNNEKSTAAVSAAMQQGRQAKGLTQRELAVKINEKQQIIKDYEAGRGVTNQAILAKIERVIGVKLRGKDIGKPLVMKSLSETK